MTASQKFTFDVSFDHLGAQSPRSLAERRFTRAELEATRQAGLAEGHAAGLEEAATSAQSLTASSLSAIAGGIAALIAAHDATAADTQRRAAAAMHAIIAKLLPGLAAKDPLGEAQAFAIKCLHEAIAEPRVVLRVAGELYELLRENIDTLASAAGYAGRIVLLSDDTIAPGDARVEWADGGAERDFAAQCAEIEALLARRAEPGPAHNPLSA